MLCYPAFVLTGQAHDLVRSIQDRHEAQIKGVYRRPNSEPHMTLVIPADFSKRNLIEFEDSFDYAFQKLELSPAFASYKNVVNIKLCEASSLLIEIRKVFKNLFPDPSFVCTPLHVCLLKDVEKPEISLEYLSGLRLDLSCLADKNNYRFEIIDM